MRNVTELNLLEFVFDFIVFQSSVTSWEIRFLPLALRLPILFYNTHTIHTLSMSNFSVIAQRFHSDVTVWHNNNALWRPPTPHALPLFLSLSLYRTELNSMKMNSNWGNERLAAVLGRRQWRIGECCNWTEYMGRGNVKQWLIFFKGSTPFCIEIDWNTVKADEVKQ